jgi:hypothetical protein
MRSRGNAVFGRRSDRARLARDFDRAPATVASDMRGGPTTYREPFRDPIGHAGRVPD